MNNEIEEKEELSRDKKLAIKYEFIRQKIIEQYIRGCKYLKIAKLVITGLFIIYTVIACLLGRTTGDIMGWLIQWVIIIFLNVFLFLIVDYAKYLIDDKVISFLNDEDMLDYGEYDIFIERDDLIVEEEEDEE